MNEKRKSLIPGGNIYRKYLAVLVFLVAAAVMVNMGVMAFVRSELVAQLRESQDTYVAAHSSFMDEAFAAVENVITDISFSSAVERRSTPNYRQRPDYLANEKDLQSLLKTLSFTSNAIDEIFIWCEDSPYLYTKSGKIEAQNYYNNRFNEGYADFYETLAQNYPRMTLRLNAYRDDIKEQSWLSGSNGDTSSGLSGIYLLQSIPNRTVGNRATICVVLDKEFLNKVLQDQEFVKNRQICLFNSADQVILSNQSAEVCQRLMDHSRETELKNFSVYQSGEGMLSHRQSSILDVEYAVFTPDSQMFDQFDQVFHIAELLTGVAVVLMLIYALIMPKKMYRPFKHILNTLDPAQTRTQTDDEMLFITDRILELLQMNHSMRSTVENSHHLVLQSILYKILLGGPSVAESLITVPEHGLELNHGHYQAAVLRMDMPADVDEQFFSEFGSPQKLTCFIREQLGSYLLDMVDTGPDEYTLCFCLGDEADENKLISALQQLYKGLCRQLPQVTIYIGVGQRRDRIQELNQSYAQALRVLQERPVQSEERIWWFGVSSSAPVYPFLPDDLEIQLRTCLEKGTLEYLFSYAADVLDRNQRDNVSYMAYQSACIIMNRFIRRMVQNKDKTVVANMIHIDPNKDIYTCQRCRDIFFSNLQLVAAAFSRPVKTQSSIIDQVMAYVEAHFRENINLDVVAQALDYTPNHLSRNFKQKKGVNFTDYLNSRRVAYARDLMGKSKLSLKDIAVECGFGSVNTLIRTFEKYEGMTPGEYRKRNH